MRPRVSTPGDRTAGALAATSALCTLAAVICALESFRKDSPSQAGRTARSAMYDAPKARKQRRLHLLLGVSNVLMVWPAFRFPNVSKTRAMPLRGTRLVALAGELIMLVTMLLQARAWSTAAKRLYGATSEEEKLRALDPVDRANSIWTEPFAVRLWGIWAGMTASLLARTDRRLAAASAALAVPLAVAPPLPPLIFAARIGWCSTIALALLRKPREPGSPA